MTSIEINLEDIPSLEGKTGIVSGGISGIGLAAAKILSSRGARVFVLDRNTPQTALPQGLEFIKCDQSSWKDLSAAFKHVQNVDIAVANAGVSEERNYFDDSFDEQGNLLEPSRAVIDVNLVGTFNFCKLALSSMRRRGVGGSIVITSSATAYAPEHSLPVYSACKLALVGLVRSLRAVTLKDNITINTVTPAATITSLLPQNLAAPIIAAGLPVSSADFVGLAVVYSAVGKQPRRVEPYGKDTDESDGPGRWHGRGILTLGETYTEVEGPVADLRPQWFGQKNTELTRLQQTMTDFR
ncbi:hypothetical protein JMJ35_000114 [Cladonia borealis]|uniref:Uncharacterized protein n=1 Tax=Cladonia borealis TaxID=184061 RepID=A0AA39V7S0_9LECA|nr:hypothetical protein JMJ35_000114 [Cladonia borealis]